MAAGDVGGGTVKDILKITFILLFKLYLLCMLEANILRVNEFLLFHLLLELLPHGVDTVLLALIHALLLPAKICLEAVRAGKMLED